MTETVWQAVIAAAVTIILSIIQLWTVIIQLRTKKTIEETTTAAARKVEEVKATARHAATKVEEVKETFMRDAIVKDELLNSLVDVTNKTFALANGAFSAQLEIASTALRKIADMQASPENLEAAEVAERLFRQHKDKRSAIDQGGRVIPGDSSHREEAPVQRTDHHETSET